MIPHSRSARQSSQRACSLQCYRLCNAMQRKIADMSAYFWKEWHASFESTGMQGGLRAGNLQADLVARQDDGC